MSENRIQIRLFVASPSDVQEERECLHRVVVEMNQSAGFADQLGCTLQMLDWHDIVPSMGQQEEVVLEQLPLDSWDIFVGILWMHFGRSSAGSNLETEYLRDSGLEAVFRLAYRAWQKTGRPHILLYRCEKPYPPDLLNSLERLEQLQKVVAFWQECTTSGKHPAISKPFRTLEDFERYVRNDLTKLLPRLLQHSQRSIGSSSHVPHDGDLLRSYLSWLVRRHNILELRGIRKAGQSPAVPLERVYIALKGDTTTPSERAESRLLIEMEWREFEEQMGLLNLPPEEQRSLRWRFLAAAPIMPSLLARDRPHLFTRPQEESLTLGEAFRRYRWLVILGDPGSGKTTLARWLTSNLARTLLEGKDHVIVPAHQVDPAALDDTTSVDLGSARLPVLVRVADFAEARRNHPTLLLADYLGYHPWLGEIPTYGAEDKTRQGEHLSAEGLNSLIKNYLRRGQAVVILDGLDEITAADTRDQIVQAVETFMRDWIHTPDGMTPFDDVIWPLQVLKPDEPASKGGNQLLLTSRIAGYHVAPLSGRLVHVTIEPMHDAAIDRYCEAWTLALHMLLADPMESEVEVRARATHEAESLKATIHDPDRPGVYELASNPLLLAILALVHHNSQARLPEQRVRLYQIAVENLVEVWRDSGLTEDEVVHVLAPLAAHIHEHYPSGLIEESEVRQIITSHLASYRGVEENSPPLVFRNDVTAFLQALREQVGLLAARGEYLYGFLHLSFQEYLAARFLVRDPTTAQDELLARMGNPRWREPIRLALGYASWTWGPKARERLLRTLLEADEPLVDLLPQNTLLVAAALPELVHTPPSIVGEVTHRLLAAYSDREKLGHFTLLRKQVEEALTHLRRGDARQVVDRVLKETLIASNGEPEQALAVATLILKQEWFTATLAEALLDALPIDNEEWDWPLDRTLRTIAANDPDLLPTTRLSFRKALRQNPAFVSHIAKDFKWLLLTLSLFGGVDSKVRFTPDCIHRDSPLTPLLLETLRNEKTPTSLITDFWNIWSNASEEPMKRVDAMLSLVALGEDVDPVLEGAFADSAYLTIVEKAMGRLSGVAAAFWEAVQLQDLKMIEIIEPLVPHLNEDERYIVLTEVLAGAGVLLEKRQQSLGSYTWFRAVKILGPHLSPYSTLLAEVLSITERMNQYSKPDTYDYLSDALIALIPYLAPYPDLLQRALSAARSLPEYIKSGFQDISSPRFRALLKLVPLLQEADCKVVLAEAITLAQGLLERGTQEEYPQFRSWIQALKDMAPYLATYPDHQEEILRIIQAFPDRFSNVYNIIIYCLKLLLPFLEKTEQYNAMNMALQEAISIANIPYRAEAVSDLAVHLVTYPDLLETALSAFQAVAPY